MPDSLWTLRLTDFSSRTASASPTPGGGSVCSVTASLGLGLVIMALEITQKREHDAVLEQAVRRARGLLADLAPWADEDVRVFESYMAAHRLPRANEGEQQTRATALQRAAEQATEVPLQAAEQVTLALELAVEINELTSQHVRSDVLAGSELLCASLRGLFATLAMNLDHVDPSVREHAVREQSALLTRAEAALERVRSKFREQHSSVR